MATKAAASIGEIKMTRWKKHIITDSERRSSCGEATLQPVVQPAIAKQKVIK